MKKLLIFWMLISLFMVSPSYAQEKQEFDETQKKIIIFLLYPYSTEDIDSYVKDGKFTKEQAKEFKKIKKAIIKQNLKYGEEDDVIKKYINGEISADDAVNEIKKIKPNNVSQNTEVDVQNNVSIESTASTIDSNDTANQNEDSSQIREENEKLREELTEIYTKNFIQKWETIPFSQFIKNNEDLFNQEYQKIREEHKLLNMPADIKQKPENFEQLPDNIQKIYNLYGDFLAYQEGIRCINNPYDEQAIYSIKGIIKNIRDNTPQVNNTKKIELDKLHTQLNDYKYIVETFQKLITKVNDIKGKIGKNHDWNRIIHDPKYVDPNYIDVEEINDNPWLQKMLSQYIREISSGKTSVENLINGLLTKQPQQNEENNIDNTEEKEMQDLDRSGNVNSGNGDGYDGGPMTKTTAIRILLGERLGRPEDAEKLLGAEAKTVRNIRKIYNNLPEARKKEASPIIEKLKSGELSPAAAYQKLANIINE